MNQGPTRDELIGQTDRYAEELLRNLLNTLAGVEVEVQLMREREPHLDEDRVADRLIEDAVSRSGRNAAAVALPSLLPFLVNQLMLGTIVLDALLLIRGELALLVKLSYLYDSAKTRADREVEALEILSMHASSDERPTNATPVVAGQIAKIAFKHLARRVLHAVWRRLLRIMAIPLSLIISAKINRDAVAELGDFAVLELTRRKEHRK